MVLYMYVLYMRRRNKSTKRHSVLLLTSYVPMGNIVNAFSLSVLCEWYRLL